MFTSHAVSIHRSRSAPLAVFSLILSVAQGNINSLSSGVLAAQHRELHLNEAVLWNDHTRMYESIQELHAANCASCNTDRTLYFY